MEITEKQEGDLFFLYLKGRLDAAASPQLEKTINALIDQGQRKMILQFKEITYLSSAGLRLLLSVCKKLQSREGKLVIARVNGDVMEVIQMAGFDRFLPIAATEEAAIALLS